MTERADSVAQLPGPYARAARAYRQAGWDGVLPLPPGVKWPPPTGYTGAGTPDPTDAQVEEWISTRPDGNVALRMPDGVIGIDVDAYGHKVGAQTIAVLEAQLGALPPTWTSSARDDGISGIRFYRVPAGVAFHDPGRDVETIQRTHRYAVVAPSVHPDGGVYTWYRADGAPLVVGTPPVTAALPWLPEPWFRHLVRGAERTDIGSRATESEVASIRAGLPAGPPCSIMTEALNRHLTTLAGGVGTRHDAMRNGQLQLLGLGAAGHRGAVEALEVFWTAFSTALDGERDRSAAAEWHRAMRGAVAAHPLASTLQPAPCIHDQPPEPPGGLQGPGGPGYGPESPWTGPGAPAGQQGPVSGPFRPGYSPGMRRVDLGPYLAGQIVRPDPLVGGQYAVTTDGQMSSRATLYPRKWHTLQGLTEAGKSLLALWHCIEEMRKGHAVIYAHFEESDPSETITRLRAFGVKDDEIAELFLWLDCNKRWADGEFGAALEEVSINAGRAAPLVVLDGMNAACTRHGWEIMSPDGVGAYRNTFVTPGTVYGAAVLSLGHPAKAVDRQHERHGFGSTAWLDEVDGVAFRMEASRTPPRLGGAGYSRLYVVKDRPGSVGRHAVAEANREPGWRYLGAFHVDDTPTELQRAAGAATTGWISPPMFQGEAEGDGPDEPGQDSAEELAAAVLTWLEGNGGRFQSLTQLRTAMRADGVKFKNVDLEVALIRLARRAEIVWPEVSERKPRPGWLAGSQHDQNQ